MSNFSTIIKEITKEKKDVLLSVLFGFIAGMAAISLFSASGYLLSKAAVGVPLAALVIIIALVKLLGVTRAFSRYVERYLSHRASFTILSHIRKTFYRKLDRSFSSLMRKHQSGDLLSKMVGDIESLQTFFLRVLYPPVLLTLMFFATIFFTAFFSIQIAIVLLVGFVLQMVILPAYFYWLFQRTKVTSRNKRSQLSTDATEYLFGYKDLKIFQKESDQRNALLQRNDDYEQAALLQDQIAPNDLYRIRLLVYLASHYCRSLSRQLWGVKWNLPGHVSFVVTHLVRKQRNYGSLSGSPFE